MSNSNNLGSAGRNNFGAPGRNFSSASRNNLGAGSLINFAPSVRNNRSRESKRAVPRRRSSNLSIRASKVPRLSNNLSEDEGASDVEEAPRLTTNQSRFAVPSLEQLQGNAPSDLLPEFKSNLRRNIGSLGENRSPSYAEEIGADVSMNAVMTRQDYMNLLGRIERLERAVGIF